VPFSLSSGHFNEDPYPDLAVTNLTNQTLIYLGNGSGGFLYREGLIRYGVGIFPINLALGDFNGDTRLDIAVANYLSNDISLLFGTGYGLFFYSVPR